MDDEDRLTETEMTPLAYMVIDTWKMTRPMATKRLRAEGKLEEVAALTAYRIAELAENLWKGGMDGMEAQLEAERQLLHIPDRL
jgi:hypothetical protein